MINRISSGVGSLDLTQLDTDLRSISDAAERTSNSDPKSKNATQGQFFSMLKDSIGEVNKAMQSSEKSSMDLVAGKTSNIHETMLAATKAEIGFNLLVQLRNKAIESYQEVMRMQV